MRKLWRSCCVYPRAVALARRWHAQGVRVCVCVISFLAPPPPPLLSRLPCVCGFVPTNHTFCATRTRTRTHTHARSLCEAPYSALAAWMVEPLASAPRLRGAGRADGFTPGRHCFFPAARPVSMAPATGPAGVPKTRTPGHNAHHVDTWKSKQATPHPPTHPHAHKQTMQ
jgi:hypothetical protein